MLSRFTIDCSVSRWVVSDSLQPPARFICPWGSPGKNTGVGCHALLQRMFPTQESSPSLLHCRWILYCLSRQGRPSNLRNKTKSHRLLRYYPACNIHPTTDLLLLLLLSRFSRVWLCATPKTAAYQAPLSLGFSRQEHWSGLPFPSPMHESEVAQLCPTLSNHWSTNWQILCPCVQVEDKVWLTPFPCPSQCK